MINTRTYTLRNQRGNALSFFILYCLFAFLGEIAYVGGFLDIVNKITKGGVLSAWAVGASCLGYLFLVFSQAAITGASERILSDGQATVGDFFTSGCRNMGVTFLATLVLSLLSVVAFFVLHFFLHSLVLVGILLTMGEALFVLPYYYLIIGRYEIKPFTAQDYLRLAAYGVGLTISLFFSLLFPLASYFYALEVFRLNNSYDGFYELGGN